MSFFFVFPFLEFFPLLFAYNFRFSSFFSVCYLYFLLLYSCTSCWCPYSDSCARWFTSITPQLPSPKEIKDKCTTARREKEATDRARKVTEKAKKNVPVWSVGRTSVHQQSYAGYYLLLCTYVAGCGVWRVACRSYECIFVILWRLTALFLEFSPCSLHLPLCLLPFFRCSL